MSARHSCAVVVPGHLLTDFGAEFVAAAGGRAEFVGDSEPRLLLGALGSIEILVTGVEPSLFDRILASGGLRWVHAMSAGVDHLPLERMAAAGVLLTNSAGAYAPAMAEYALAGMIVLARQLPSWLEGQRHRQWIAASTFGGSVLRGKLLGIVGYGAVGRLLAAAAKSLGMEVWASRRSPMFISGEPIDRLLPANRLHELLASADFLVLAASLNRSTEHLIGQAELDAMKPSAVLVNVARGRLIDETALVRTLRAGGLGGALLDVTSEEPLPFTNDLWTAPNVLITPHISGNTPESWRAAAEFFCRDLELYLAGAPERMGNLIDYSAVL